MTDVRSPVQMVLQDAGYGTWLSSVGGQTVVIFEDDAVMGFVCVFDDVQLMLRRWREMETGVSVDVYTQSTLEAKLELVNRLEKILLK
jgi:hypothetical protein